MAPRCKGSDTDNLNIPKRSLNLFPLSEEVKNFTLIRKEKESYDEVAEIYSKLLLISYCT
jgi:hypothetical protein